MCGLFFFIFLPKLPRLLHTSDDHFVIGTSADIENVHAHLFSEQNGQTYNPEIIPLPDHEQNLLRIQVILDDIVRFDTYNQELQVLLEVFLDWHDHRLAWDPDNFGGVHRIDVSPEKVWYPSIGLGNSAEGIARFTTEDNTNNIEVNYNGPLETFSAHYD